MNAVMQLYGVGAGHLPRPVIAWIYSRPWATRMIRAALTAAVPAELQEVEVLAGPLAGSRFLIYPRNELSFMSGLWEFWVLDALLASLHPGDTAWDIGAYIGYFTLLMHRRCHPGTVVALEPDPANRARLMRTLDLNRVDGIRVLPNAAGARDEVAALLRHDGHPAATTLGDAAEIGVPVITLDALCARVGSPHLIKVDVEGAEADVLRGATRLLREVRPLWIMELHGHEGQQAVRILQDAGYRVQCLNERESRTHQAHVLAVP